MASVFTNPVRFDNPQTTGPGPASPEQWEQLYRWLSKLQPGWARPQTLLAKWPDQPSAPIVLPPGPVFHITGTAAIDTLTVPAGFTGGLILVIPDDAFTWTTTGNIGKAGTAVPGVALSFVYDPTTSKFWPSYV